MKRIHHLTICGRLVRAHWVGAMVLLLTGLVRAEDERIVDPYGRIAEANRAFAESRFYQALGGYDQAAVALGDSHALDYNRAAAHYKLGDYVKAAELFARAALSENGDMTRRSRFGWGNCDYAEALSKLQPVNAQADPQFDPQAGQPQDLEEAIERLQSAQRHYRDALSAQTGLSEDDPANRAPRGNIERAEGLIEAIQELMQQQQQQQPQSGDQDQDQQPQDDSQEQEDGEQEQDPSQPSDQEQDEQQQQGQQDSESQEEDQAQPSQAQQEQDASQDDAQAKPQEAQEAEQLGPEEIEAILQSVRDKEKQRRVEKRRRVRARRQPVAEDW